MEPITVDVSALQDLPQDEQPAIDDLAGAELGGDCSSTCSWTCFITCLRN
jgi:hypothetical protein